jgi:hypothetical protein
MRKLKLVLLLLAAALAAAQFFQPARTNPSSDPAVTFAAVVKPPQHVSQILERSCRDCHSHATVWPWYSRVAPVSWLVAGDVKEGRNRLNLSVWNIYSPEMSAIRQRAICEEVKTGEMPPKYYTPLHPQARLTGQDVSALCSLAVN